MWIDWQKKSSFHIDNTQPPQSTDPLFLSIMHFKFLFFGCSTKRTGCDWLIDFALGREVSRRIMFFFTIKTYFLWLCSLPSSDMLEMKFLLIACLYGIRDSESRWCLQRSTQQQKKHALWKIKNSSLSTRTNAIFTVTKKFDSKTSYDIFDSQLQLAQRWKKQIFKGLYTRGGLYAVNFFLN